jgi:hypothetical protein
MGGCDQSNGHAVYGFFYLGFTACVPVGRWTGLGLGSGSGLGGVRVPVGRCTGLEPLSSAHADSVAPSPSSVTPTSTHVLRERNGAGTGREQRCEHGMRARDASSGSGQRAAEQSSSAHAQLPRVRSPLVYRVSGERAERAMRLIASARSCSAEGVARATAASGSSEERMCGRPAPSRRAKDLRAASSVAERVRWPSETGARLSKGSSAVGRDTQQSLREPWGAQSSSGGERGLGSERRGPYRRG